MIAIFPKIAECAKAQDYEMLGCMIRNYFAKGGVFAPILNLNTIYKDLGIPIRKLEISGIAAAACKDEKGSFSLDIILHPDKCQNKEDERFLLAHLLGHFFLYIQPAIVQGEWATKGILIDEMPHAAYTAGKTKPQNDYNANKVAAAMLMPKGLILRAAEKFDDKAKLAAFFGVSKEVAQRRLSSLQENTATFKTMKAQKAQKPQTPKKPRENIKPSGMERLRQIAKELDNGF